MGKKHSYADQATEELLAVREDLAKDLFKLRCDGAGSNTLERPHMLRETKRNIARVLTVLRQRKEG